MSVEQIWVLTVLAGAFLLLVTEWLPVGITGLLIIVSLILGDMLLEGGIQPAETVYASLVNTAVIAVGCMFVISSGITRTGAVGLIANVVMERPGSDPKRVFTAVLLLVMGASAFMNNTPLVLIFMPVILGLSERMKRAPSKTLIPLSFISIMGGMCTLVGTSTNIVVASSVGDVSGGELELRMFDFLPMGIILGSVGAVYLFCFGQRLLPERASLGLTLEKGIATEYMTELEIFDGSDLIGKQIGDAFPRGRSVRVLQVIRNDVIRAATRDVVLEPGDLLLVKGEPAAIMSFDRREDTGVIPAINIEESGELRRPRDKREPRRVDVTLAEVVLTPGSRWVGRRVREVMFRERYRVSVFAVQRHGSHLREKVDELRLRAGDILLVQGSIRDLSNLKASDNLLVIEGVQRGIPHRERAPVAVFAVAIFVVLAGVQPTMVHFAAMVAALVMVLTRCLTAREAYSSLDLDILFLLAGTLALGGAFEATGLAGDAAQAIVDTFGSMGETATVGAIYLLRNPLDVAISSARFYGVTIDLAIAWMADPGMGSPTTDVSVRQVYGTWSTHLESWTQNPMPSLYVIRYEDMLDQPFKSFAGVAKFLGLNPPRERLQRAIANSSFRALRKQEDERGFVERSQHTHFFRVGRAGQWRKVLSEAQIKQIISDHREQMERFDYVPKGH